jgi:predicted transcriptional regulator
MRRTQIYLDDDQAEQLGRRARASGVTKSTVIREAIASYLSTPDEADELARFQAALDAAGERPIDLPDGQRYVEALRAEDLDRDAELEARRAGHKRSTSR